jgi:Ca2+-binding EF-hand superfamily protein
MTHRNTLFAAGLVAAAAASLTGTAFAQAAAKSAAPANAAQQERATPENVFNAWDKDKSKSLSVEEFKAGWTEIQMRQAVGKLHQNFVQMDVNKSGALEQSEFANLEVIKKAGAKAPMMSAFDADKNGKLEFKEYVEMISSMMRNNAKK